MAWWLGGNWCGHAKHAQPLADVMSIMHPVLALSMALSVSMRQATARSTQDWLIHKVLHATRMGITCLWDAS